MRNIPRLELWNRGINFNYSIKWKSYVNSYDNCYWQSEDIHFIRIAIEKVWFATEDWEFDDHTLKSVTIFGIQFAKGYFWQAEKIK